LSNKFQNLKESHVMKTSPFARLFLVPLIFITPALLGAEGASPATWHAQSLGQAVGNMLLFTAVGIAAAVVGYKIFDKCTPGDLSKEILENKNVAAAILVAAVILGVCLIVAAAMIG
jgi:putative membrane protein